MLDPEDLTALQGRVAAFADAEARVAQARQRSDQAQAELLAMVTTIRAKVATPYDPDLVAVLRLLYWQQPGIRAQDISAAAGFSYHAEMLRVMGTCPSGIYCISCGSELQRTSRSWTPGPGYKGSGAKCPSCTTSENVARSRQHWVNDQRRRFVDQTPIPGPACDWLAISALVVAFPPVASGFSQAEDYNIGVWSGWENGRSVQQELIKSGTSGGDVVSVSLGRARKLVETASSVVGWDPRRSLDVVREYGVESAHLLIVKLRHVVEEAEETANQGAAERYPEVSAD